jgi:predicted GNAT family N-acyltransferase
MKDGDQVVATATATDLGDRVVKIRQVAVDFSLRGKGHGREIMLCSEEWAKEAGFKTVSLHARAVVMEFYLKLGYEIVGDGFEEVGIPHRKMVKKLD